MANDKSRKFKQNQIIFCVQPWFVEYSRPIVFGEDRLREMGSLPATVFFIKGNLFCLANDNSRKFKQNQIIFCIQPWCVECSRPIVLAEDRLREMGSLPATFYVLTRVIFPKTNNNCRKFKQNQLHVCIPFLIIEYSSFLIIEFWSVDFVEDRLSCLLYTSRCV